MRSKLLTHGPYHLRANTISSSAQLVYNLDYGRCQKPQLKTWLVG